MRTLDPTLRISSPVGHEKSIITTTLYELWQAISEETKEGEEDLISQTLFHLIHTGRLKWIGK